MLDTTSATGLDRRPAIVICAWDDADSAWDLVEDLSGEPWNPNGARTIAVRADEPTALAARLGELVSDTSTRAVLLVGRSRKTDGFVLQMRAENRGFHTGERLDRVGPSMARATAPVAEIVRALIDAGMVAEASSEAEDDAGSYLLYRVLAQLPESVDTPAVGLLRAPHDEGDESVRAAIKAAAQAMARHLSPLPRPRVA
ncbi:MAG: hypothetical protein EON90_08540 [Brevundimonas sp.]|nr:MAG: hypothetical protein EON90_08540 [Brevundimonas sp.]